MQLWNFFNSNFFVALSTFIVGGFAILIYFAQKKTYKRDAASVIISEIQNAERVIDSIKRGLPFDPAPSLLPSNNWNKYSYLFIKDLDNDETDLVNNFYAQCMSIVDAINQLSMTKVIEHKSMATQHGLSEIAKNSTSDVDYKKKRVRITKWYGDDEYSFYAKTSIDNIQKATVNIRFVSTASAGQKIKKIASGRFLVFF